MSDRLERARALHREAQDASLRSLERLTWALEEVADLMRDAGWFDGVRRAWLDHTRDVLWHEQQGMCALCSAPLESRYGPGTHVDHIIPFAYGGSHGQHNLQLAHATCNTRKGATVPPDELLVHLEDLFQNRR